MPGCDVAPEVQSLFSKQYEYKQPGDWRLPGVSELLSCPHDVFPCLQTLKESLNQVKNQLSDKKLDAWHRHTSFTNIAGRIVPEVRRQANAELCTQAWCKFQEIVCTYPLLPGAALWDSELNSIHLCEAPGAFISSLNHYIKSRHVPCDWNWVANTLNPYHEANDGLVMIVDDRLIANTLPTWYFGPDNTGDIMAREHLDGLLVFISNMSCVHLVTADGSFDCQADPGEQEALVYPLHYCEVVTGLAALSPGGSFLLKMFTLFEHSSVNLLFLLNCCFHKVHVIKPGTSKAGNSEVYVVCLGYVGKGAIQGHLQKMVAHLGREVGGSSLFPRGCLPPSFLESHRECCAFFHQHQTRTILENLQLFPDMGEDERARLSVLRESAVAYYLDRFQVRYLPRKLWLVRKPHAGCRFNSRWAGTSNRRSDTFNERKCLEALTWTEKVARGYLGSWVTEHGAGNWGWGSFLEGSSGDLKSDWWCQIQGRRLTRIQSSAFCDGELLSAFNETIEGCMGGSAPVAALSCSGCRVQSGEDVVAEFLGLVAHGPRCLVAGVYPVYDVLKQRQARAGFLERPLPVAPLSVLHDGDPAVQQQLLGSVLGALQHLQRGDSLLLPLLSCLTRFTAAVVYVLHHCFHYISFSCPASHLTLGADALLFCCGFHPLPGSVTEFLQGLKHSVDELLSADSPQQVLEFIPMDELLRGHFLEFLWDLNSAVMRRGLHLMAIHETTKTLPQQTLPS